jgi:hypothetical protein
MDPESYIRQSKESVAEVVAGAAPDSDSPLVASGLEATSRR